MNVLITGASGMIGSEILSLCLSDTRVSKVVSLVRRPSTITHSKLEEHVVEDFLALSNLSNTLGEINTVYYCLGVYTGAVNPTLFRTITVDYPVALAHAIKSAQNNAVRWCFLSGQGADRTEKSRMMFARDKGVAENKLVGSNLGTFYSFRPGYIYPVEPRSEPNLSYRLMRSLYPLLKRMGKKYSVTSHQLALAMFETGLMGNTEPAEQILENEQILQRVC